MYVAWRRRSAISLASQGFKQKEIAALLDVSPHTISSDLRKIREEYDGLTTREWALIVEERVMGIDQDIYRLRRMIEVLPHRYIERPNDEGEVELMDIGPDIDQELRIRNQLMALENRRDQLLGIDKAAAARHVETKKLEVVLSFDQTPAVREIEPGVIEAEIVDG
jgi:predicted transcriptional regulator